MTPVYAPTTEKECHYNYAHVKTRVRIEQSFGILEQRFLYLCTPLHVELKNSHAAIIAIFCLHNFAIPSRQRLDDDDEYLQDLIEASALPPSTATTLGRTARNQILQEYF